MASKHQKLVRVMLTTACLVIGGGALYAARSALVGWAMRSALRSAGADDVRLAVRDVTLRRLVVEDVGFRLRRVPIRAERVTMRREHWWTPTLGKVDVAGARVGIDISILTPAPEKPAATPSPAVEPPKSIPAEAVTIDGQLVMRTEGIERALKVSISAQLDLVERRWQGRVEADGPGVTIRAEAAYLPEAQDLAFRVSAARLDLGPWSDFVKRVAPVAAGDWNIEGRFDASAEGRIAPGRTKTSATVELREGAFTHGERPDGIRGVTADLVFNDLLGLQSAPEQRIRVAEIRAGDLSVQDLDLRYQLKGARLVEVSSLEANTLGGRIRAEPFQFAPSQGAVEATLLAEALEIGELLALAPDVPARATGRVDGRLPVRFIQGSVRFGTGWLGLTPGVAAEVRLNAKGLLTRGMNTGSPAYAVLSKIEGGILELRLDALDFKIHPPGAPEGRSAQLHLSGLPVDRSVKAPVSLDVNVNGPVERLLDLGLDSRMHIGSPGR